MAKGTCKLGVKYIFLFGAGKLSCPDNGALRKTKILQYYGRRLRFIRCKDTIMRGGVSILMQAAYSRKKKAC